MNVILNHLPFPPTSNTQYVTFFARGKLRHAASPKLRAFKKSMEDYARIFRPEICVARENLATAIKAGNVLEVNLQLCVPPEYLYTKDGKPRKWDVSNRVKAIHDAVGTLLNVDDSLFWAINAEKKQVLPGCKPYCRLEFKALPKPLL